MIYTYSAFLSDLEQIEAVRISRRDPDAAIAALDELDRKIASNYTRVQFRADLKRLGAALGKGELGQAQCIHEEIFEKLAVLKRQRSVVALTRYFYQGKYKCHPGSFIDRKFASYASDSTSSSSPMFQRHVGKDIDQFVVRKLEELEGTPVLNAGLLGGLASSLLLRNAFNGCWIGQGLSLLSGYASARLFSESSPCLGDLPKRIGKSSVTAAAVCTAAAGLFTGSISLGTIALGTAVTGLCKLARTYQGLGNEPPPVRRRLQF